ncbi:Protein-glutamine gamma-glutamyltransferase [compost metagenome]
MKLEIMHTTRYTYEGPVTDSVNEIRLTPRTNYRQACYHQSIAIEPNAALYTYEDYFGNRVHAFTVNQEHRELVIRTRSTVVTRDQESWLRERLDSESEQMMLDDESFQNRYMEFLLNTPYTLADHAVVDYMNSIEPKEKGMLEWVIELSHRIRKDFRYSPNSTQVNTTVLEFLGIGEGVCQDFAHLMIAVCRARGIPARYVSGYHFVGDLQSPTADFEQASHAWVEAHIPGIGWIGFDPTNNGMVNWRYVKLGHGRDYHDIVPVKGVYFGNAAHQLQVTVDVKKL